jgi:hypothetical protein
VKEVTESAARSNYRATRGILFAMKEACPVGCDVAITLDGDGNMHLKWRWNIKREPYGFELSINPSREHLLYLEIENAKNMIKRECESKEQS